MKKLEASDSFVGRDTLTLGESVFVDSEIHRLLGASISIVLGMWAQRACNKVA